MFICRLLTAIASCYIHIIMKKLLRPTDILKLGLAGALDVFEEISDPLGIMAKGCKELYGWVPSRYRRSNFSRVMLSSLKTGDIKKVVKKGKVYLRLTSQGKEKIERDFTLLTFQRKKWDGKWRVVFYDISEKEKGLRDALRGKLGEMGFGMIQRSVWITPHDFIKDMEEFIEANKLEEKVFILEGRNLLAGDSRVLANKVWKLDKLNKAYEKLEEEIEKLKRMCVTLRDRGIRRKAKSTKTLEGRCEKRAREIRGRYLEILLTDPLLPKQLLPKGWMREKVRREIKKIDAM